MRHQVRKHKKFNNKDGAHRKAMLRNLATSFFMHKSLQTTEKRAKAVLPIIDKLINTVNTKEQMNAIRFVQTYLFTKDSSLELFRIAASYKDKKSGFTRMTPVSLRDGDNAKIVKIELI